MLVRSALSALAVAALSCAQTTLVARHLTVHVSPGEDVVVALKGYSTSGRQLSYAITSLPTQGALYQLSQVYSDYGYDPKKAASPVASTPSLVTGSKARVVFSRPFSSSPLDTKFTEFTYTVYDGSVTSAPGIITVSHNAAVMTSHFNFDTDGWQLIQNQQATQPIFDPTSRGPLSYYVYATEAMIQTNPQSGTDMVLWYFAAPLKFLGNQWYTYGGVLSFLLAASEGDFTARNDPSQAPLVLLDCATCNLNAGVRLAWAQSNSPQFDGATTAYTVPLLESAGWRQDPKNTLLPWTIPSQCQFLEVLSKLSGLYILGDFTTRYETVALDTVQYQHGPGYPLNCY